MSNITGKSLIKMGFEPAAWFGEALAEISQSGVSSNAGIREIAERHLEASKPAPGFELRDTPAPIVENITASSEDERNNVEAVRATMSELMRTPTMVSGVIMPDACPSGGLGTIPVGGVATARNAIHPGAHSADICCSMMTTSFGNVDPKTALDAAHAFVHFGPGERPRGKQFRMGEELLDRVMSNPFLNEKSIVSKGHGHLATSGDGNHFCNITRSEATGEIHMVTHHGSRGFGAMLYKAGMIVAEKYRRALSPETLKANAWIPFDTEDGRAYWEALQIVRDWTKLNHTLMHDAVDQALGGKARHRNWNEHNFVFREEKDGENLFHHAKGATPIDPTFMPDNDGTQIVPLNMAQPVLIIKGDRNERNNGFAPHGAGRNLSRTAHKRRQEGRTEEEIFAEETQGLDVRFYSKHIDTSELPSAYKDANAVQEDMSRFGLADVVDRLQPYGSIMAGDIDRDAPWRKKARAKKAAKAASA